MISRSVLENFNGKKVKITAINIKCVEDIEEIKQHLIDKYGEVQDNGDAFLANGKKYTKPWLPRERTGVFRIYGDQYYIESELNSAKGRMVPRRSFYSLNGLTIKNESTLVLILNSELDYRVEYQIQPL